MKRESARRKAPFFLRLSCRLASLAMLLPVSPSIFAAASVVLEGPEELVGKMRAHLPADPPRPRRLQAMLEEMLATEGYFSPDFEVSGSDEIRRVRIDPGVRTQVNGVNIDIDGPVDAETRKSLIAAWRLPAGWPFRQQDWSEAKQQVLSGLLAAVHADARLIDSRAEIDAPAGQARLSVRYDAGPPYRFGALRVAGLHRYPVALVERYNRAVAAGHPYREEDLAALQSALLATPYFASARVALDRAGAISGEDGTLTAPVAVNVRERPAHRFSFGTGVSSNTGARVEAGYHTPNLFNRAWVLDSGLRIEQKQQTAYADVALPPDERNRRHAFGLMSEATYIQGLRVRRHAFGVQTTQARGSIEQRLSLNWERERLRPDGEGETVARALALNVQWIWRRVDNPLDPHRGTVLQARIGGASRALLSDRNFVRLHGRWLQYIPLGERDTLAVRVEAGATLAPSREGIPQDYLFRAGGTGSVRGYSYQSLGVKDGAATVGGRCLAVFSAEATHWISPVWGIAAFIDAGDAADRSGDLDPAVGLGFGARWKSPAGPIGIDLARGRRNGKLHLHFALAIPF